MQALAVDKSGVIYAATNPDGKVYKIGDHPASSTPALCKDKKATDKPSADSLWSSSVYFEPGTKYIWDLVLDDSGNLYVATGDHGEIFRVTPKGEHSVFFKSDEAHIRVMAFDGKGNLIAGSDGSGLVYRISPSGEGFVLYSAPKKEITALAIDKTGNIYAAGVGEKHGGTGAPGFSSPVISIPTSSYRFGRRVAERYRDHERSRQRTAIVDQLSYPRCWSRGRLGNLSHRPRRLSQPLVEFSRGHRVCPRF